MLIINSLFLIIMKNHMYKHVVIIIFILKPRQALKVTLNAIKIIYSK